MLFMLIERFKDQNPIPVYRRVRDPGIKFPEGLTYVGSWIEPNFDRCFQLMECDDLRLLQEWVLEKNRDLGMSFEIVPVGRTLTHAASVARSLIQAIVAGLSAAGEVFGMQTMVVNPPAAAARAPDAIVSL